MFSYIGNIYSLPENHLTACWIAIRLHRQQHQHQPHWGSYNGEKLLESFCLQLSLHSLFLSLMISIVGRTQHAHSTEIKSFPLSTVAAKELWCNSWQQLKSIRNESYSIAEEIDLFASAHRNNTNGCCPFNTQLSIYECALTYWRDCVRVHVTGKHNWALDTFLCAPYDFHGNCSRK